MVSLAVLHRNASLSETKVRTFPAQVSSGCKWISDDREWFPVANSHISPMLESFPTILGSYFLKVLVFKQNTSA